MRAAPSGRLVAPAGVFAQRLPQGRQRPAEPGLRRAEREVEGLGHGRHGHPDVVVEHEDGTLLRRQGGGSRVRAGHDPATSPVEVADRLRAQWRQLDLDRPATTPPGDVEAGVDGQSMEPGVEPVRVAQARKVAPGPDVRLLDRVSRELLVPEDEAGDGLQPRDGRADEHGEGVMIAPACPLDEIPLVHRHPRDAPNLAAFKPIGVTKRRTIPIDPVRNRSGPPVDRNDEEKPCVKCWCRSRDLNPDGLAANGV